MTLQLSGVSRRFRDPHGSDFWAVRGVDLSMEQGEFVTLVGPSGCGKTTVLNCIAGLLEHTEGSITVAGAEIDGPGPERAMVFQQPSLLPWRTARRNVEYGMEMLGGTDRQVRRDRAERALDLTGLRPFADYFVGQLSGGMQQRVNLARALAVEPGVLLMDEPFAALDAMTKERMQEELVKIVDRTGVSVVFVTHDIEEAIYLADRVVVMGVDPGHVKEIVQVPFERPRPVSVHEDPEFQRLRGHLRRLLEHERQETAAA